MVNEELLQCYNRGCGQKFTSDSNTDDACCHHPGEPFFHDAYKGWSCCNKKCTDFTEFLNFKGCTRSKHSNIKPPEPEKPTKQTGDIDEIIEVKPITVSRKERPPFDTPLTKMAPDIAPSLKTQVLQNETIETESKDPNDIPVGTACKNGGCSVSYAGPDTNNTACIHHSGVPIFHEGLKYWSCCQRKTTDFNTFLSQVGCEHGKHLWIKQNEDSKSVKCRWDYHQTGTHVVVAIYAKEYCVKSTTVELNPIRLKACLVFPKQLNATFDLDIELQGIVDVEASHVSMYGTKVEIKLRKAEPGSWPKLEILRQTPIAKQQTRTTTVAEITPKIDAVDLDDL